LNRNGEFASPGYIASTAVIASKAAQDSAADATAAAAEVTTDRQRIYTQHHVA